MEDKGNVEYYTDEDYNGELDVEELVCKWAVGKGGEMSNKVNETKKVINIFKFFIFLFIN